MKKVLSLASTPGKAIFRSYTGSKLPLTTYCPLKFKNFSSVGFRGWGLEQALTSTCKAPVLPHVIYEGEVHPFKFWFNNSVRDGIFYRNELFCWLQTVSKSDRAKLYQEACRLAQRNVVVVTIGSEHCGLWISLRSADIVSLAQRCYLSPQSASLPTPPFRISS